MSQQGRDTKARLVAAAEQLFGERGVAAVSLREINLAAGQRNTSALHYHFGSRDGLLAAIVAPHVEALRTRRRELQAQLAATGDGDDLRAMVALIVRPYAEFLLGGSSEVAYVRIVADLVTDPSRSYEEVDALLDDPVVHDALDGVTRRLRGVPRRLVPERLGIAVSQIVHAVADRARLDQATRPARDRIPTELFIENLVDMTVGALVAPAAAPTRRVARRR